MLIDMATIQIRNVPADVHRTYQRRAAEAGQSLQEYLLAELIRNGRAKTPAEVMAGVERRMAEEGPEGYFQGTAEDIVEGIRADRDSR